MHDAHIRVLCGLLSFRASCDALFSARESNREPSSQERYALPASYFNLRICEICVLVRLSPTGLWTVEIHLDDDMVHIVALAYNIYSNAALCACDVARPFPHNPIIQYTMHTCFLMYTLLANIPVKPVSLLCALVCWFRDNNKKNRSACVHVTEVRFNQQQTDPLQQPRSQPPFCQVRSLRAVRSGAFCAAATVFFE